MEDFANLFQIIKNFFAIQVNLYGFTFTWGGLIIYSLLGSLIVGVIVSLFKSHE